MTKQGSFHKIDYRIRPAKNVERKMLCETFRQLSYFEPIENYRYVGFGSTTFTDFILFHKALNISKMVSIEKREDYEQRFEFNKPYRCIELLYGDSNDILPLLPWNVRTITWLDYDGKLTESVLDDIFCISENAISGNMFLATINVAVAHYPKIEDANEVNKHRLDDFIKDIGEDNALQNLKGNDLEGEKKPDTCRKIIENKIEQTLSNANEYKDVQDKIGYKPLFNIIYRDGAKMLTVGGIFYAAKDYELLNRCKFNDFPFVNKGDNPYKIDIPIMTPKERQYLNIKLPSGNIEEVESDIGLTEEEIINYAELYRYIPAFAEVELA